MPGVYVGLEVLASTTRCTYAQPQLSESDPCPAHPWRSAGRGGAGAEREEWRGSRVVPAGYHLGPSGRRLSCCGAGGGGFGEGAAFGSRRATRIPALAREPGAPLGNPLRASSSRPPPLVTSQLHPHRIQRLPSASQSERWYAGLQGAPTSGPRLGLAGLGQQHGHQALLRQPLR